MRRALAFALLVVSFDARSQAPAEAQAGTLRFHVPEGWSRIDRGPGVVLVPPQVAPGKSALLIISPPESLPSGLGAWAQGQWAEALKTWTVAEGGVIKTGHSPSGLETTTIEARLVDKQNPANRYYSYLQGLRVGSEVRYYQFLSNSDSQLAEHLRGVRAFEASLAAATATASPPVGGGFNGPPLGQDDLLSPSFTWDRIEPARGSAGLDGLYRGVTQAIGTTPGSSVMMTHLSQMYYAFFPDGRVYVSLPEEGLENFNIVYWHGKNPAWCGSYKLSGDNGTLTFDGDARSHRLTRTGKGIDVDGVDLARLDPLNGLRLEGTFRRRDWPTLLGPQKESFIRFTKEGRFEEHGLLQLANVTWWRPRRPLYAETTPGAGSYSVSNNSLTLLYDDGRKRRVNFSLPDGVSRGDGSAFAINNWVFVRQ